METRGQPLPNLGGGRYYHAFDLDIALGQRVDMMGGTPSNAPFPICKSIDELIVTNFEEKVEDATPYRRVPVHNPP